MALRNRSTKDNSIFLIDNDWKNLKMQLLKLSARLDDVVAENKRLSEKIAVLETSSSETIYVTKTITVEPEGFTFIL